MWHHGVIDEAVEELIFIIVVICFGQLTPNLTWSRLTTQTNQTGSKAVHTSEYRLIPKLAPAAKTQQAAGSLALYKERKRESKLP